MRLVRARHGHQAGCGLMIAGRVGPTAALERFHTQVLSLSNSVVVHEGAPAQQIAMHLVAVRARNASGCVGGESLDNFSASALISMGVRGVSSSSRSPSLPSSASAVRVSGSKVSATSMKSAVIARTMSPARKPRHAPASRPNHHPPTIKSDLSVGGGSLVRARKQRSQGAGRRIFRQLSKYGLTAFRERRSLLP